MAKIISTHSFRGGTGKSNTTANLAVLVARAGHRVGVIDTDIQSPGIHVIFQLEEARIDKALNDYLWGRCRVEEAAYDVTPAAIGAVDDDAERPRLFLIPSSLKTGEIARILREGYDVGLLNDGFKELLKQLKLDYLFIDTHPGVNEETLLSIAVSDMLVLILRPDNQDFQGTAVTVELARRLEVPQMLLVVNKVPPAHRPHCPAQAGRDGLRGRGGRHAAAERRNGPARQPSIFANRLSRSSVHPGAAMRGQSHPGLTRLARTFFPRGRLTVSPDRSDNHLDLLLGKMKSAAAPLRETLRELHAKYAPADEGKVADYIPELAKADPQLVRHRRGHRRRRRRSKSATASSCSPFNRVSKPFVYGLALEDHGRRAGAERRSASSRPAKRSTRSCSTKPRTGRSTRWSTPARSPRPT